MKKIILVLAIMVIHTAQAQKARTKSMHRALKGGEIVYFDLCDSIYENEYINVNPADTQYILISVHDKLQKSKSLGGESCAYFTKIKIPGQVIGKIHWPGTGIISIKTKQKNTTTWKWLFKYKKIIVHIKKKDDSFVVE